MRAFITGGIGFIGTNLAYRLLRKGHEVVLFDNLGRAGVEENLRWLQEQHFEKMLFVKGDVREYGAVEEAMHGSEIVFHLARAVRLIFIRPTAVPKVQPTNMFEIITVFMACLRLSFGCPASTDHTSAEPKTRAG